MPWWNPYGAHIESVVPLPWPHVFFSERVLLKTCSRVYAMPEFRPRKWDVDENRDEKTEQMGRHETAFGCQPPEHYPF